MKTVNAYVFSSNAVSPDSEALSRIFTGAYISQKRFFNEKDLLKIKNEFDLIVFYNLPREDALPILRQLTKKLCLPIYFLSDTKEADLILEAFKLGIKDFFVAPFNVREISERIQESIPGFSFKESKADLARKFIEVNFSFPLRLVDIAKSVRCTPEHLTRIFHSKFKITPHAYLMKVRLNRAKEYLLNTNYPLSEIQKFTGFYSVAHLCREFKRLTNMTPFNYRQKHAKLM